MYVDIVIILRNALKQTFHLNLHEKENYDVSRNIRTVINQSIF